MSEAGPPTNMSATTTPPRPGATPAPPPVPPTPAAATGPEPSGWRDRRSAKKAAKVSKWDRPRPPMDWRWWVGGLGKVLIAVGLLMFGFVAYQLWGTGIETARAQRALESEFEELLASAPEPPPVIDSTDGDPTSEPVVSTEPSGDGSTVVEDGTADATDPDVETVPTDAPVDSASAETEQSDVGDTTAVAPAAVPIDQQVIQPIEEGDAVARIEVPAIGVNDIVVAGVTRADLKRGPGHFPETPLPGQLGNVAIAGHRTTYGQPFHNVDKLNPGDDIVMTTPNGTFVYNVVNTQIVAPSDYQVIATSDPGQATLTLVSCHPKWTTRERIVVSAELDPLRSNDVGEPIVNYGRPIVEQPPAELPGDPDLPGDEQVADDVADDGSTVDATSGTSVPAAGADIADTGDGTNQSGEVVVAENGESTVTGSFDNDAASGTPAPGDDEVNAEIADAFAAGWFSDPGANSQVALWGVVVSAIAALAYLLSRTLRRDWVGALVGIVPFAVALYFFFQNVNRLLPPAL
ncbi:MAG: sortase [Actinomycetota bacterium]